LIATPHFAVLALIKNLGKAPTVDRCRFTPPWREGRPPGLRIRWDHNLHDPKLRYIQGVVALGDTPSGAGAVASYRSIGMGPPGLLIRLSMKARLLVSKHDGI
jgi:hypothetical protein